MRCGVVEAQGCRNVSVRDSQWPLPLCGVVAFIDYSCALPGFASGFVVWAPLHLFSG